jgi:hypothetical protein
MIYLSILLLALLLGLGACSDAATRLAYDIESAALKLEASEKNSTGIKHTPSAYPDGGNTFKGNKTIEIVSIH